MTADNAAWLSTIRSKIVGSDRYHNGSLPCFPCTEDNTIEPHDAGERPQRWGLPFLSRKAPTTLRRAQASKLRERPPLERQ